MFKGKVKSIYKILILAVVLVTASVLVGVNLNRDKSTYAAINYDHEEFSAIDDNGLILSVEKVYAISAHDFDASLGLSSDEVFETPLYSTSNLSTSLNTMLTQGLNEEAEPNRYYYSDISENGASKYVVRNGDFVMLNNQRNTDETYYTPNFSAYNANGTVQNMQEAIMVSFGQYYFNTKTNQYEIADENEGAKIQTINVVARRNGEVISLPAPRNYSNNLYEDFVCIIPQSVANEGYYEFTFTYFYGGLSYTQTFNFYILFNTSYNSVYQSSNTNNSYPTTPTIENATVRENVYRYYMGQYNQNLNYPTLTYDYTRYKLSYTHTANGVVTTYDYSFVTNSTAGSTNGQIIQSVTSFGVTTTNTYYLDYYGDNSLGLNFVTLVFTEAGNYDFSFEYIYSGYNSASMPEMNLTIPNTALVMSGFELKYTLAGKDEADFRYLTISSNSVDQVDIIVPNGYRLNEVPSDSVVGVMYSLVDSSTLEDSSLRNSKVGTVVASENPSLNHRIENAELKESLNANGQVIGQDEYVFNYLLANINSPNQHVKTILDYIRDNNYYVKTNQGSIWATGNDNFNTSGSFYYYSSQPIVVTGDAENGYAISVTRSSFVNTTTFTRTGYYLLFINVDIAGETSNNYDYTQIFAFQYTTDTININVETLNNDGDALAPLGSGQYTNKNVQVSWKEPGVFERKISAYYYSVTNQYLNRTQLLNTTAYNLSNGGILGTNINDNQGATFLIELRSEGMSASYHIFTIDRTPIQEIGAYAVNRVSTTNNATSYEFLILNGNYVKLSNSITDSLATLYWADKVSGAGIQATYTFTPFVRDSSIEIEEVNNSSSAVWFNTNYKLGTTVGSFDIEKVQNLGNEVPFTNVLYRQGIYIFTLTDEAGNSAKFMFIIDSTESFFKITDSDNKTTYESNASKMFSNSVTVEVGTHKAIELDLGSNNDSNRDMRTLIQLLVSDANNNAFSQAGYYVQSDTNINALKSLFGSVQGTYYLTVRNNSISSRTGENADDPNTSITQISINNRTTRINYVANGATSTIRTLYMIGENQYYTAQSNGVTTSNSRVTIEINVDNSRGFVYYSANSFTGENVPTDGSSNEGLGIYRINTGSNVYNDDGSIQTIGMVGAHATSENYLGFVFNVGTGSFEVSSVSYDYYELNLSEDSYSTAWNDEKNINKQGKLDKIYYYNYINSVTIYADGSVQNGGVELSDGRVFALLNVENSRTREGLYVIHREYNDTDADLGDDTLHQTYYVIVDRNGIIDQNQAHIGGYINLGLKEDETTFNEFNTINAQTEYFSYSQGNQTIYQNKPYSLYLTSDKLPITLNIPIAKYFGGKANSGSTYYAGRLSFEFYFRDLQNQLDNKEGRVVKLFEINSNDFNDNNYSNGIYTIDLRDYLTRANSTETNADIERIIRSINQGNWICLPGDYIVVIKDTVESAGIDDGAHEKVIGFRIEQSEVYTDVYSVPERNMTVDESQNLVNRTGENTYSLVTSEEFVKIDMDEYFKDSLNAGLDLNYLVVTQTLNERTTNYINHVYQNINGTYQLNDSNPQVVENTYGDNGELTSRVIYLNTYLRDESGNIDIENLSQSLSYNITIRFRLANSDASINDRYINCYYYYDNSGNLQTYYEATITVIIDRVAPTNNIDYLVGNDPLVRYYIEDNGEDMFESSYIETNSNVYFVNQYKTYYATGDNSKIYAFRVQNDTEFNSDDIYSLYYRYIPDITSVNLSLPAIANLSNYTSVNNTSDIAYYNFLTNNTGNNTGHYEILEMDEAGNTTQYVVFYDAMDSETTTSDNLSLLLKFTLSSSSGISKQEVNISQLENGKTFTIFDVDLAEEYLTSVVDKFYRISLTSINDETDTHYILTNATTEFTNSGLMTDIKNLILDAGNGNYILRVETRTGSYQVTINYYDENYRIELNIENLVEVVNGSYQINLHGANVRDTNGILYYASTIEITQGDNTNKYECVYNNGQFNYYLNGDTTTTPVQYITELNGTYQIKMTDAFGEVYTYKFNTTGTRFYSISFGEDGEANYYEYSKVYYAFDQVNIQFDNSLYYVIVTRTVNNGLTETQTFNGVLNSWEYLGVTVVELNGDGNVLYLYPYYSITNDRQYTGAKISYTVKFVLRIDNSEEFSYNVMLDSNAGQVNLTTNGLDQRMTIDFNADYQSTQSNYITSGTSNLTWTRPNSNDILNYSYTLYELKSNGEYVSTDLSSLSSYVISTQSDSEGLYKFVIDVLSPTGAVLGNVIYTFQVLQNSNELYYVTLPDNSIAEVNSSFKFSEIEEYLTEQRLSQLGVARIDLPSANVDLYVYNQDLNIQIATDKNVELFESSISLENGRYLFTIYRAHASTYSLYFATLKVNETNDIVSNITLTQNTNSQTLATSSRFSFIYPGASSDSFTLSVTPNNTYNLQNNLIITKNTLVLDIYLNDEFILSANLNNYTSNSNVGSYRLLGNGKYTFVFKDLAGNVHTFTSNLGSQQSSIDITILKEPIISVNDMAPIDNAYYNGGVVLSVYNPATYDIGSIAVTATRNGANYTPIKSQYDYTFLEYGTYRVVITANYTTSNSGSTAVTYNLTKVIVFTIINPNEARESIDLTSLSGFEFIQVLHGETDITELFNSLFNPNSSGRLLTYNMLLDHQEELNISSGKQLFTITYRVDDGVYPIREVSFSFTMNNEIPNIYCSLESGETTTSGFTISFNPGIIYEQAGESLIYVNDSLIYTINSTSPLSVLSLEISEAQYGAGDYYVRLVSASGQVITSFKAVIKEPLNTWAIVIIVVVSVIVIAIIVTIILLRRKMRIR